MWNRANDSDAPTPMSMLGRYRDNVYVAFSNVPAEIRIHLRYALSILLRSTYNIPLKWEPHGLSVT